MAKVIIMRGLPGAGKSTWANRELMNYRHNDRHDPTAATIVSADHFFMKDGEYKYNPSKIGEAHKECMRAFLDAAGLRYITRLHCLIVDNTNVHRWEYMPYVSVAEALGHEVEIVEVWPREYSWDSLAQRNAHGVPASTIARMGREWEDVLPWQKVTKVYTP